MQEKQIDDVIPIKDLPEYLLEHRGRWIINTRHALERWTTRYAENDPELNDVYLDIFNRIFKDAIDKILDEHNDHGGKTVYYLVHSKVSQFGVVIAWNKDFKRRNQEFNGIITTLLPAKPYHHAKKSDILLIVEKHIKESLGLKEDVTDIVKYEDRVITFQSGKIYNLDFKYIETT